MSDDPLPNISEIGKRTLNFLGRTPAQEKSAMEIRKSIRGGEEVAIPRFYVEIERLENMDLITTRQKDSKKPERGGRAELMVKMSDRGQRVAYEMEVSQGDTGLDDLQPDGTNRSLLSRINTSGKGLVQR